MTSKKEVTNECLLVNYVAERGDGAVLVISLSNESITDIYTLRDEKVTLAYTKLSELIRIIKEDFKE